MAKKFIYIVSSVLVIALMIVIFAFIFDGKKKPASAVRENLCLCTAYARKYKRDIDNSMIPAFTYDRNGFDCV